MKEKRNSVEWLLQAYCKIVPKKYCYNHNDYDGHIKQILFIKLWMETNLIVLTLDKGYYVP